MNFLGLDLSTQQLKATIVNEDLQEVLSTSVEFDKELPEYRTNGGVQRTSEAGSRVTAPTIMWVKAMDMLLAKLRVAGLDFSTVTAVSGAAQQHGSVYWKQGTRSILQNMNPDKFLYEMLLGRFSISNSPVWMDSTTKEQCEALESFMGGPECLAEVTGSRAFERFTGPQISRSFLTKPEAYKNTERISVVSSFVASLLLGDYAPIDLSDASGMNLLDIKTQTWSIDCIQACAPELQEKLGEPVTSNKILGPISPYHVERYGFSSDCKVVAFTGDNPASLAGMRLQRGEMAVSLGTSDTLFLWLDQFCPSINGHVFINPIVRKEFMGLLCFKNGSLTRSRICEQCAENSWQLFSELLESTPRGNFGNIGFFFDFMEIQPPVEGDYRFNKNNEPVHRFSKEVEVRAVIEGQFLQKRVYAEDLGFCKGSRVIATGGASTNKGILQVLADIFNAPVYVQTYSNSASLGSAYRAKYALMEPGSNFLDMFKNDDHLVLSAEPAKDAEEIYSAMAQRYRSLEKSLMAKKN